MPLIEMAAGTNTVPWCTRIRCLACPSIYLDIVLKALAMIRHKSIIYNISAAIVM